MPIGILTHDPNYILSCLKALKVLKAHPMIKTMNIPNYLQVIIFILKESIIVSFDRYCIITNLNTNIHI